MNFPDPEPEPLMSAALAAIARRAAKKASALSENLHPWAEVLDALGWCVAIRFPRRPVFLSPHARRWLFAGSDDATLPAWETLGIRLGGEDSPEFLIRTPDSYVWRTPAKSGKPTSPARLTGRESEIFQWLRAGKTGPEIATILGCAPRTVESHVARLYRKLGIRNRSQLFFQCESTDQDA